MKRRVDVLVKDLQQVYEHEACIFIYCTAPYLTTADLFSLAETNMFFHDLVLQTFRVIHSLDFSQETGNLTQIDAIEIVSKLARKCRTLNIGSSIVGGDDKILETFVNNNGWCLQVLDLHNCTCLTSHNLRFMAKKCVQLKILHLNGVLGCEADDVIFIVQNCKNLTSLNLALINGVESLNDKEIGVITSATPNLTSLNIAFHRLIGEAGAMAIAKNCSHLNELIVAGTGITMNIMEQQFLPKLPNLKFSYIYRNFL